MEITQIRWLVWLEGRDKPVEVITDQRDFAAYEAVVDGDVDVRHHRTRRNWCWTAMKRAGQIDKSVSWEKFNEELCIEAALPDKKAPDTEADDSEDEQGLDPGRTEAPGGR